MSNQQTPERRGLLRKLGRWLVKVYYPRIEVAGADRIPQSGPVLLCANHGNSLIDPLMVGLAARRPVRFMAKAPLFEHPILGPPMSALGMVPAYRGSEDSSEVRRNLESLEVGAKLLVDGQAMGIFPEGRSTERAHLEMIRSGAARMAIQAFREGAAGLQVVPVGITYERKDRFRSAVLVRVARPIDVQELLQKHEGNDRKARRALTSELQCRLQEVVVHLEEPEWEPWLDDLRAIVAPQSKESSTPGQLLWQRKRIADAMNYFLKHDRQRVEAIAEEIESYRQRVHASGLRLDSEVLRKGRLKAALSVTGSLFWLVLLFIPALLGTLHHLVPFVLVRSVARRVGRSERRRLSSYRMLVGIPVYLIWYVLVISLLMLYSPWLAWGWLAAAPFAGLIAIHYWRRARRSILLLYQELRVAFGRVRLTPLRQQLFELRQKLLEMADQYLKITA